MELKHPLLATGQIVVDRQQDVILKAYVQKPPGLGQLLGQIYISIRKAGIAGRVIMRHDY